jgi:hypothetical protein
MITIYLESPEMPFEFIQIPANGQGEAKVNLNKLLSSERIATEKKETILVAIHRKHYFNQQNSLSPYCSSS